MTTKKPDNQTENGVLTVMGRSQEGENVTWMFDRNHIRQITIVDAKKSPEDVCVSIHSNHHHPLEPPYYFYISTENHSSPDPRIVWENVRLFMTNSVSCVLLAKAWHRGEELTRTKNTPSPESCLSPHTNSEDMPIFSPYGSNF